MSEEIIYEPHPLAKLFPPMGPCEYKGLKADIEKNGLRNPIVLFERRILDGWNRYRACLGSGISPVFVEYEGDDPLGFVVSMNLNRRHLTPRTTRHDRRQVGRFEARRRSHQAAKLRFEPRPGGGAVRGQ